MKKSTIAISIALTAVLAATPTVLAGCSSESYSGVYFPSQDVSYVVTSQGGSVVAYGNYVYFINGTRGYDDTEGSANVWGDVVKGGLYRAEYNGAKVTENGRNYFERTLDSECYEFKYTKGKDYFDKETNIVDVTKIAPKTIGTSGYANGGLFIYDNYIYFASPNNEKTKSGRVQSERTDFFMMPLSGGVPVKVYTSSASVDTSSSAYAFYKLNGNVYLVVNETTSIISVKIDVAKQKADDPVCYDVGATSVYFPVRDTYYDGISTNTAEDFVYFVRAVKDEEPQRSGTVIEGMRPDGSDNFIVSRNGATETIEAVRNGIVFYRTTQLNNTYIKYTNLHNVLMAYSASYKAEQEGLDANKRNVQIDGQFPTAVGSLTSTYAFRADENSNEVFFVGVASTGMTLYQDDASPIRAQLCTKSGTPLFINNNYLYFRGDSTDYYRVPLFSNMDDFGTEQKLVETTTSAGISCDYADGYFTYFGTVDQWANGYSFFYKVDGVAGMEPQFVGMRAGVDIPDQAAIDEAKENKTE